MSCEIKVVRRVEFCDTDMAGIVHYSNFFRYMEVAEHEFFRSLGFSVDYMVGIFTDTFSDFDAIGNWTGMVSRSG